MNKKVIMLRNLKENSIDLILKLYFIFIPPAWILALVHYIERKLLQYFALFNVEIVKRISHGEYIKISISDYTSYYIVEFSGEGSLEWYNHTSNYCCIRLQKEYIFYDENNLYYIDDYGVIQLPDSLAGELDSKESDVLLSENYNLEKYSLDYLCRIKKRYLYNFLFSITLVVLGLALSDALLYLSISYFVLSSIFYILDCTEFISYIEQFSTALGRVINVAIICSIWMILLVLAVWLLKTANFYYLPANIIMIYFLYIFSSKRTNLRKEE